VIDTRKVAALVYKRREHIINLWISQGDAGQGESEVGGYHVLRWSRDGLTWRAVSDLDVAELRTFATTIRNR
jgi:anti-sigma factor RsiW